MVCIALGRNDQSAGIEVSAMVEKASAGNIKPTWVNNGRQPDWLNRTEAQGRDYLRRAIQVKNIWVPYRA
ncbi:hypothetical protein [Agrobacterium tumefaciens]|uniref:hypothetical protein n=1 Tax=Agrobacterium tumefaciens TaxID=358 RepID=UPI002200E685|nr:hypothetical protein FY131_13740 [Agrobacterium tumefaciens]